LADGGVIRNGLSMRHASSVLLCLAVLLAGCEGDLRSARVVPTGSVRLGLPDRIDPPSPEKALDITGLLEVPAPELVEQSADSVSLLTSGGALLVNAALPPLPARDMAGLRLRWKGTLGGDRSISWAESPGKGRQHSLEGVTVPGESEETTVEIGFGPTRLLGPRVEEIGVEIPPTEVGLVVLSKVELLLRPGWTLHRVELGKQVREVLAPAVGRALEWDVEVPDGGIVEFEYGTHPTMRSAHGDGTRFVAEIVDGGRETIVLDRWLSINAVPHHRSWQVARLDLSRWSGRSVVLRLVAHPGPEASGIFPASAITKDDEPLFTIPRLVDPRDARPNVLLVVIDTLRRDALGSYGRGPSPAIDGLAAGGVRFDRMWAAGSWTHPSTASLLSGWAPSRHGLGYGPLGTTRLAPGVPMVARDFVEAGWATAATSNNKIVSVAEGFADGFVAFDERAFENDQTFGGERITRAARSWLREHPDGPFFLYLHYFDPHDRYQAPTPFTRRHVSREITQRVKDNAVRAGRPNAFIESMNPEARELTGAEIRYLRGLYQGEVEYVDHCVGRVLDLLEEQGRLDDTIVVVTSDHGEEFLEHGGLKHAHTLYEELVAVPLVLRLPGGRHAGTVRAGSASLMDLPASLRQLAGLEPRPGDRPWLLEGPEHDAPVIAENWWQGGGKPEGLQQTIVDWPYKFIRYGDGSAELFDLVRDPGERDPIDDEALAGRMTARLDSIVGDGSAMVGGRPVDPALLEKLKAMGYVH
jgi:hypothetical protein